MKKSFPRKPILSNIKAASKASRKIKIRPQLGLATHYKTNVIPFLPLLGDLIILN